jgi:hypothetical protein
MRVSSAVRAEHVSDAKGLRRPDDGGAGAASEKLKRTGRRQQHRQSQPPSELFDRGVHPADVAQHAGAEGDRIQRQAIAPERRFRLGPAHQRSPGVLAEILASLPDDLVQVLKFVRAGDAAVLEAFFVVHLGSWVRSALATSPRPANRPASGITIHEDSDPF